MRREAWSRWLVGAVACVLLVPLFAATTTLTASAVTILSYPIPVTGSSALRGIACSGPSTCVAVGVDGSGTRGAISSIELGHLPSAVAVANTSVLSDVACVSTACLAVGRARRSVGVIVPISGGSPGPAVQVPGATDLTGVACPVAGSCVAVGHRKRDGIVVVVTDGVPGPPQVVKHLASALDLTGVACPTTTSCFAVGSDTTGQGTAQGALVAVSGGVAGPEQPVATGGGGLHAVACPTATVCVAVGSTVVGTQPAGLSVPVLAGHAVPGHPVPAGTDLQGVACTNPEQCLAVGPGAGGASELVPLSDGVAQTDAISTLPAAFGGIACAGPGLCESVGASVSGPDQGLVLAAHPPTPILYGAGANFAQIDSATGTVLASFPFNGASPYNGVTITPDGTTALVAGGFAAGTVTVVDLATDTAKPPIVVGGAPTSIAVTPDGHTAFVTNVYSTSVTPIDLTTNTPEGAINVGDLTGSVDISPDGKTAYVARALLDDIVPIDVATHAVGAPIETGLTGFGAGELVVSPDGTTAYLADQGSVSIPILRPQAVGIDAAADVDLLGAVVPIDLSTGTHGALIPAPTGAFALAMSPDGSTLWIGSVQLDTATPMDTTTHMLETTVSLGAQPSTMAVTPDGSALYVTATSGGPVAAVDTATATLLPPVATTLGLNTVAIR